MNDTPKPVDLADQLRQLWATVDNAQVQYKKAEVKIMDIKTTLMAIAANCGVTLPPPADEGPTNPTDNPTEPNISMPSIIEQALLDIIQVAFTEVADAERADLPQTDRTDQISEALLSNEKLFEQFQLLDDNSTTGAETIARHIAYLINQLWQRTGLMEALLNGDNIESGNENAIGKPGDKEPPDPGVNIPDVIEPPPVIEPGLVAELMRERFGDRSVDPNDYDYVREIGPGKEFDPTTNSDAIQRAIQSVPADVRNNAEATVLLLITDDIPPGTEIFNFPPSLCGWSVSGERGKLAPAIYGPGSWAVAGCRSFNLHNLELVDLNPTFSANRWYTPMQGWSVLRSVFDGVTLRDCRRDMIHSGNLDVRPLRERFGADAQVIHERRNMMLWHGGQGNAKHNMYEYFWGETYDANQSKGPIDTDALLIIDNVFSAGSNGSIAIKAYAPHMEVRNCSLSSISPVGDERYVSQLLLDTGACHKSLIIENCDFDNHVFDPNIGNATAIGLRARRSFLASAIPSPLSMAYKDSAYWSAIAEKGEITPEHPDAMPSYIKNCNFNLTRHGYDGATSPALFNDGTRGIRRGGFQTSWSELLLTPANYVERACTVLTNCTFEGYEPDQIYEGKRQPWIKNESGKVVLAPEGTAPERKLFIRNTNDTV